MICPIYPTSLDMDAFRGRLGATLLYKLSGNVLTAELLSTLNSIQFCCTSNFTIHFVPFLSFAWLTHDWVNNRILSPPLVQCLFFVFLYSFAYTSWQNNFLYCRPCRSDQRLGISVWHVHIHNFHMPELFPPFGPLAFVWCCLHVCYLPHVWGFMLLPSQRYYIAPKPHPQPFG